MTGSGRKLKQQRAAAVKADVERFAGRMQHAIDLATIANNCEPRRAAAYLADEVWDLFQEGTIPRLSRAASYG